MENGPCESEPEAVAVAVTVEPEESEEDTDAAEAEAAARARRKKVRRAIVEASNWFVKQEEERWDAKASRSVLLPFYTHLYACRFSLLAKC